MRWLALWETSLLGLWVRESTWGFPISLTLHAFGMGLVAGISGAMALRLCGVAPGIPLPSLRQLYPAIWLSALLALVSGVMLLSAYPAKSLTNPLFYLKLALIAVALWQVRAVGPALASAQGAVPAALRYRGMAILLLWIGTVTAGRFLAYTYSVLMISDPVP